MAFLHLVSFSFILSYIHFLDVANCISFNAIVASDGSGNYKTIAEAIAAAPRSSSSRFYIRVKPGTYKEHLQIPSDVTYIALISDDASTTKIVDDRSDASGFSTYNSATMTAKGENFMVQTLTIQNSVGPQNGQAVALLDEADHTTYYKCIFMGFQDTLYSNGKGQFFKECDIYGSVDFIFGGGATVFQDCNIHAHIPSNSITITAQSNEEKDQFSGFSFQNCRVTVSNALRPQKRNVKIYLGRPWRPYSTVVFMESFLDDMVAPQGWMEWEGVPVNLLFYAEYNNKGPGSDTSKRVNWPGFHRIDKQVALKYTVENLINGTQWLPETVEPFRTGLLS